MTDSCIYYGQVAHQRLRPITHRFQYDIALVYLDLEELESPRSPLRKALKGVAPFARFHRKHHLGSNQQSLDESVRELIRNKSNTSPGGRIGLLTQLSQFGFYFNPLSLYFCYDKDHRDVESVVAEVNNTPWNEQHTYVLDHQNSAPLSHDDERTEKYERCYRHAKTMHVSPFMPMSIDYHWTVGHPGQKLNIKLDAYQQSDLTFGAEMRLKRRPLSVSSLQQMLIRYPFMTARVIGAIYWQAIKLWWKKCPTYLHPRKIKTSQPTRQRLPYPQQQRHRPA